MKAEFDLVCGTEHITGTVKFPDGYEFARGFMDFILDGLYWQGFVPSDVPYVIYDKGEKEDDKA